MINRILIRVKAVQTLYSYLLVEKDFALEPQPSSPTKEKRFAYSLYLDMLMLMSDIARDIERRGGGRPLYDNRFMRGVLADDRMRSLTLKYSSQPFQLRPAVDGLVEKVKASAIYKNYLKDKDREESLNADVDVWRDIFNIIIAKDPELAAVMARRENYSLRGVDRAIELMDATFVNFYSSHGHLPAALATLERSLMAARDLYFRLLTLPVGLTRLRERQLDENRHKYLPTEEDKNPNLRFVENQLVEALADDPEIAAYCKENKLDWMEQDKVILTSLLKAIIASDLYKEYMTAPVSDFHSDSEFWRNVFKQIIFRNEAFLEEMEDKSVFWNDDIEIIGTFVLKTFKRFDDMAAVGQSEEPVLPMFKDDEDARFGRELLTAAIENKDDYRALIDRYIDTTHWDTERLALMDVVILLTAIAEVINFPKIATSVSVNEYIEISKSYCNPRNAGFIHGVLGKVIAQLREEGVINKP